MVLLGSNSLFRPNTQSVCLAAPLSLSLSLSLSHTHTHTHTHTHIAPYIYWKAWNFHVPLGSAILTLILRAIQILNAARHLEGNFLTHQTLFSRDLPMVAWPLDTGCHSKNASTLNDGHSRQKMVLVIVQVTFFRERFDSRPELNRLITKVRPEMETQWHFCCYALQ